MQTDSGSKKLWKMGGLMALSCLVPLALLAIILAFQIPLSTVALFAIVLICPAMHLFMMRGHNHGGHGEPAANSSTHTHEHGTQQG